MFNFLQMFNLCSYLIELCLVDRETIKYCPSKRAAAALALGRTVSNVPKDTREYRATMAEENLHHSGPV